MRPDASDVRTAADVRDWYWTRSELLEIARRLGARRSGSKQELAEAIVAVLSGRESSTRNRVPRETHLTPPFQLDTQIPTGQPFTRVLREWVQDQVQGKVQVNAAVRSLLKHPRGATLADLVAVIQAPAPTGATIGVQFERNRFMRLLSRTAPELSRSEREDEWTAFRQLPSPRRTEILASVP